MWILDRRRFLAGLSVMVVFPSAFAQEADKSDVAVEWSLGRPDAPVTVIEYASITCHHCQNFHLNTWPAVKARYVDTGKVRFVIRPFPLDKLAMAGFMLASCAKDGRWYEVVDRLYQRGESWAHEPNAGDALKAEAAALGFSANEFETCLGDQAKYDALMATSRGGSIRGVTSTPTFFINGVKKVGAPTIEQFAALVDPLVK